MVTPEERAEAVVKEIWATHMDRSPFDCKRMIAAAIREAVNAKVEQVAELAACWPTKAQGHHALAQQIRSRKEPEPPKEPTT